MEECRGVAYCLQLGNLQNLPNLVECGTYGDGLEAEEGAVVGLCPHLEVQPCP